MQGVDAQGRSAPDTVTGRRQVERVDVEVRGRAEWVECTEDRALCSLRFWLIVVTWLRTAAPELATRATSTALHCPPSCTRFCVGVGWVHLRKQHAISHW